MRWWRYCLVLLALFTGMGTARGAVSARDDTGHEVMLSRPAKRVVSLAPSSTEMVFAVGAGALLVGVSTYDDFPPAARKLPKIGTFSGPDLERIVAFRPDLVVAAYGNPLELIDRMRQRHIPVYVSNPSSVDGVLRNLQDLGRLTGRAAQAASQVRQLRARLGRVTARVRSLPALRTLVVIWDEPLTVAGGNSFIQDILRHAGGVNVVASLSQAYPKLDPERLPELDPEVVLFPVGKDKPRVERLKGRPGFRQTTAARTGRVYTLNPDWLMRPGPRVVQGVEAVARLLQP
jgi:iron complex transport system substrate-binding protein